MKEKNVVLILAILLLLTINACIENKCYNIGEFANNNVIYCGAQGGQTDWYNYI